MRPNPVLIKEMCVLGLPAAGQLGLEVGVFGIAAIISGHISTLAAAAHQIVISIASLTFMIPLGIGNASGVRVGYRLGAGDPSGARLAGWLGIGLSVVIMTFSCVLMLLFPEIILSSFTKENLVLSLSLNVLFMAALFQIFDGIQVCTTGTLRGLGDTRVSMIANLVGHYCVGLPLGLFLAFKLNQGLPGLWTGLATGLFVVAVWLTWVWNQKTKPAI